MQFALYFLQENIICFSNNCMMDVYAFLINIMFPNFFAVMPYAMTLIILVHGCVLFYDCIFLQQLTTDVTSFFIYLTKLLYLVHIYSPQINLHFVEEHRGTWHLALICAVQMQNRTSGLHKEYIGYVIFSTNIRCQGLYRRLYGRV